MFHPFYSVQSEITADGSGFKTMAVFLSDSNLLKKILNQGAQYPSIEFMR